MHQLIFCLCLLFSFPGMHQPSRPAIPDQQRHVRTVISHQQWDSLLQAYVSPSGQVDYQGFARASAQLNTYLTMLAQNPPRPEWAAAEQMTYWINAYNAFTVRLIVDHYPLNSIRDLDNGTVWDRQWIELGDNTYSLNQIEHDILRKQFKDPRIPFAVNCAAASCPPLLNRAYTARQLDTQLEQQTRAFINNPQYNKIGQQEVIVSKLFEWYSADFGDLRTFLNRYTRKPLADDVVIRFRTYNWALNER